nr:PhnD/SsuA/transferrin family substrate-binding protein [Thiocystis violascens]
MNTNEKRVHRGTPAPTLKTIRCGLLPGESRTVVERLNEPLRLYLERVLRAKVEMVVGQHYVATGEALRRGELDLAYLGPVTYILQSRDADLEPFARPTHGGRVGPTFQAAIIAARWNRSRSCVAARSPRATWPPTPAPGFPGSCCWRRG